jgi:hypothetical protein
MTRFLDLRKHKGFEINTRTMFMTSVEGYKVYHNDVRSWGGAVGIADGYGLDYRKFGVPVQVWTRICNSPYRPDEFWGSRNLLSIVYGGHFKC